MKTNKQLLKICMNIYKELYKNAQPSVDFSKLIKSDETKKSFWFMKYYLDNTKIEAIINKHIKKHKLNNREKKTIFFEVWLGCSPTGNKDKWEK